MSGGTFISQNKVRPGAYINFKAVPKPLSSLGTRGVVTMPIAMSWGDTITELYSTDLIDGTSIAKIGYSFADAGAKLFRLALKNCYKAIIYRLDTGGGKATATIGNLTATAKYAGIVGNSISIIITANGTAFDVATYYAGVLKDKQTLVETVGDLIANAWVDFSGTAAAALAANAGTSLTTGTNGTISDATYTTYLAAMHSYAWNTMGIPYDSATVNTAVIADIAAQRDTYGKKVQVVLYNATVDYEGVITCAQGYATAAETISPTEFIAYLAGLTAGSNVNSSNTYHAIPGAVSITYPSGVDPYTDVDILAALALGELVLSTRQDGVTVIEQDINSLHTFTVDKPYSFSKNRVIRTLDEINNSTALLFQTSYIGKVNNDVNGRNIFKADLIRYLNSLQRMGAIQNFDSSTDILISAGLAIDAVVVDLAIQPVDAMEKLYMTVSVG
ncbi:MAG: phage tail sheath C-terminal domain-containing protein [Eubacteriales bacterium]|nr:phage tail sheath C-terminal domain-containing protein [Eubacteriales bacterium]